MNEMPKDLSKIQIPTQPTRFKFFVVWMQDDVELCCDDSGWAESEQVALSTTLTQLTCLACGQVREATPEIAEIVM